MQRKRYVYYTIIIITCFYLYYHPDGGMSLLHLNTSTLSSVRVSTLIDIIIILLELLLLQRGNFCVYATAKTLANYSYDKTRVCKCNNDHNMVL